MTTRYPKITTTIPTAIASINKTVVQAVRMSPQTLELPRCMGRCPRELGGGAKRRRRTKRRKKKTKRKRRKHNK